MDHTKKKKKGTIPHVHGLVELISCAMLLNEILIKIPINSFIEIGKEILISHVTTQGPE